MVECSIAAQGPPEFLLVRGDDLVLLGVRFAGFDVEPGGPVPRLVPRAGAQLELTLPPQALAEEKLDTGASLPLGARLGAPSRVTFDVTRTEPIAVSVEGVLAAIDAGAGATVATGPGGDDGPTAIELPWRLVTSVVARDGSGVVSDHSAAPAATPAGAVGLWRARLRSRGGPRWRASAGLGMVPLRRDRDVEGLATSPLSEGDRQAIVSEGRAAPPEVERLELSALGGSLSARLRLPALEWDHELVLGRDVHVRLLSRGVLFPFGHRAEHQVVTERVFEERDGLAVAGLRRTETLVVTEPVRRSVEDAALARQFPFAEVEILTRTVTGLMSPECADVASTPRPASCWQTFTRTPLPEPELQSELDAMRAEQAPLESEVRTFLDASPTDFNVYLASDFGSAPGLRDQRTEQSITGGQVSAHEATLADGPAQVNQLQSLFEAALAQDPPDQATIDDLNARIGAVQAEMNLARAELPALRARLAELNQAVEQLEAAVAAEFNGLPRTAEALAESGMAGGDRAQALLELRARIAAREALIAAIAAQASEQHNLFFVPGTAADAPVRFPLRCAGAAGDVMLAMPLVYLRDIDFAAEEHFAAFASLTDSDVAARVAAAWQAVGEGGSARLAGERVDLVRSAAPKPGDVHEVHELAIAAVQHGGRFAPILTSARVALPALRALLPGHDDLVDVGFTDEFLASGADVEAALAPLKAILVDFGAAPDRSGGLVTPSFSADAISRTFGPVATAALPGVGQDLLAAFADAKLLGFDLVELVLDEAPVLPPEIVQLFEDGLPSGVRMAWDLPLKERPPFKPEPGSKLALRVEASPERSLTTCTVDAFSLALPSASAPLLTVRFESLRFTQEPGRAPRLELKAPEVEFEGALNLLKKLQTELQRLLPAVGRVPGVEATRGGVTARYAVTLPEASAGAFSLRNIAVRTAVEVPFERRPVTVSLSFASREDPFNLSVLMFGGGGYIDLQVAGEGRMRLEASLEFGASVAVNFLIASGEVHALGGFRFLVEPGGSVSLDGFIRFGGSVEVLGLVSVSVELVVTLTYRSADNRLVGRAKLVIEIDLTLFSDSVEIDSGDWVLIGSDLEQQEDDELPPTPVAAGDEGLARWREYREAFAPA